VKSESLEDERETIGVEHRGAVHELEVKVRPARVPRVPELAEDLPLPHPIAAMDADAAGNEVRVGGEDPLAELEDDVVAVRAPERLRGRIVRDLVGEAIDGFDHLAGADRQYRLAVVEVALVLVGIATWVRPASSSSAAQSIAKRWPSRRAPLTGWSERRWAPTTATHRPPRSGGPISRAGFEATVAFAPVSVTIGPTG
jgi:hypothetical protein